MAKQTVNIGVTANDNTGDPLRTAFDKLNDNFDEVYAAGPVGTNIQISDNTIASTNTNGNIDLDPAGTGTVILNGPTEANGVVTLNSTVTGNIVPTSANTYNLGSSSAPFKEIFVSGGSLHVGNLILKEVNTTLEVFRADGVTNAILSGNSTTAGTVLNNGNTVVALTQDGPITFFANNYQDGNATVTVINTGNITTPEVVTTGNIEVGAALLATGIVQGSEIVGLGDISSVSGNVTARDLIATNDVMATGNVGGMNIDALGNVNVTNDVIATNLWGTLQVADQPNVTGLGELTDLQVAGDLSMTNAAAVIDSYDIVANGTVTATEFTTTTGNTSVSDSGITFADGTTQSSARNPNFYFLTSNGSAVQSSATNAFGVSASLDANHYYEFMAHLILDNDSTGNIGFGISGTAGDEANLYAQATVHEVGIGFVNAQHFNGTSFRTTAENSTTTYHVMIVGSLATVSATDITFTISTSAGNVTPLAGSNFRFSEYITNSVGSIS